jgi:hypothetical protein
VKSTSSNLCCPSLRLVIVALALAPWGAGVSTGATLERVEVLDAHHATALHLELDGPASNVSSAVSGSPPQLVVQLPWVKDATGARTLEVGGRHARRVHIEPRGSGLALVVEPGDAADPFHQHGVAPTDDGLLVVVGVDEPDAAPVVVAQAPSVAAAPPVPAGSIAAATAAATAGDTGPTTAVETPTQASAPASPPAASSGPHPIRADGLRFRVDRILLSYAKEHPDAPPLSDMMALEVDLGLTPEGYVAPRDDVPMTGIRLADVPGLSQHEFYGSAIRAINESIVTQFNELGLYGVLVLPNEEDVDPSSGRDLRPPDVGELRLVIWLGRLLEARTFASGERVPEDQRIDAKVHQRIRDESPIQPGDLLRKRELDDYVARLNRHPGRSVDTTLSAATEPGGIYLDYLVAENRPYSFYAQVGNIGNDQTTKWRERFGTTWTQVTNRDDIFRFDYVTGNFDSVNGIFGSYESPIYWWWLRGRVMGNWSQYDASEFAVVSQKFSGDLSNVGGQLVATVYQYGNFFTDLWTGVRYQDIGVDNSFAPGTNMHAETQFFWPEVGLMLERNVEELRFRAAVSQEFNAPGVAGTSSSDLSDFGRLDVTQTDIKMLRWDAFASIYLEPLLFPHGYRDPETPLTSTLAHELFFSFRGQYSYDDRLIPQIQRVVGGMFTARGYKESMAAGDSALIGRFEYRFHLPRILPIRPAPARLPVIGDWRVAPTQVYGRPDWDLIIRPFVDYARTIQYDKVPGESNDTLLGTGVGIELRLLQLRYLSNITLSFDWGHALKDAKLGTTNQVKAGRNEFYFLATISR